VRKPDFAIDQIAKGGFTPVDPLVASLIARTAPWYLQPTIKLFNLPFSNSSKHVRLSWLIQRLSNSLPAKRSKTKPAFVIVTFHCTRLISICTTDYFQLQNTIPFIRHQHTSPHAFMREIVLQRKAPSLDRLINLYDPLREHNSIFQPQP